LNKQAENTLDILCFIGEMGKDQKENYDMLREEMEQCASNLKVQEERYQAVLGVNQ